MIDVKACPICEGQDFSSIFECVDYTVSHETFPIKKCASCGLLVTSPRPGNDKLDAYYLSQKYISHSNTSASLMDKVYQISRLYSLRFKLSIIKNELHGFAKTPSVLDFGCGTGDFLSTCKGDGFIIDGVEPSPLARNKAIAKTGHPISASLSEIDQQFDSITLWHVLEHVSNLNETLETLTQRLQKNGTMFIAVPNHQSSDAHHYQQFWAAYDVPRHLWHFDVPAMHRLITKHDLRITRIIPMKLDAFYVSMLSEAYKNGKQTITSLVKAFLNGMRSNWKATETTYSSLIYVVKK